MKPSHKLRFKSVLKTLLLKEKLYKSIRLYSVSFLCWLIPTYICHSYFLTSVNVLWTLCSAIVTLLLTRYLLSKIFSKRDLIHTMENQLIESKILTENDRGILAVLVDDLGRESSFLPSTHRVYNLSIMSLMYARLARHSEAIKRHQPKFPQEIVCFALAIAFFLMPNVIAKIDFTLPTISFREPQELTSFKKHMSVSIHNYEDTKERETRLNRNNSVSELIQRSTELRLNQEEQKNINLSQDNDFQSDDIQNQRDRKSSTETKQSGQGKAVKSRIMMGQVGGRASGQSINFDQHIRERQRLVEVAQVNVKAKQIMPQTNRNKTSNSQASSTKIINKVLAPSKNSKKLQQSLTLTNSRRQKLRNEAYLLGSPNQEKSQNLPPALRMLIHQK